MPLPQTWTFGGCIAVQIAQLDENASNALSYKFSNNSPNSFFVFVANLDRNLNILTHPSLACQGSIPNFMIIMCWIMNTTRAKGLLLFSQFLWAQINWNSGSIIVHVYMYTQNIFFFVHFSIFICFYTVCSGTYKKLVTLLILPTIIWLKKGSYAAISSLAN